MKNLECDPLDRDRLKKLGVETLIDLALLLPYAYENTFLSSSLSLEQTHTLHVRVTHLKQSPKVLQITFYCDHLDVSIEGVFFAPKPYQKAVFKKESELYIQGKISYNAGRLQMVQPRVVTTINALVSKYKTPLQNKTVVALMKRYLSVDALLREGLSPHEADILLRLHFPNKQDVVSFEQSGYSRSVIDTLKCVEIYHYLKRLSSKKVTFPSCALLDGDETPFIRSLPFSLTQDQHKVISEIKQDFLSPYATKRVVMGDVGCGKTMVILASVMMCYPKRSILMAPTTVLATQLYDEAKKYLPACVKVALVTQVTGVKEELFGYDFLIGTHALLYRELPECSLVMVDEQHRFGTKQRALLASLVSEASHHPHYIQFSATPIPRTLSMIHSSLVDYSFIKMLPFPKDITTSVISKANFKALIAHIHHEIAQNHQCIIVYPLVEESDAISYQSIEEGRSFWEKNFQNVYVTYGKDKNKEEILAQFKEQGHLLISTTVVEVGISLPRLSTIVIVGAERLGLASLHQLRGRVSRNGLKGYCFLYTNLAKSERLEKFSQTLDGFEIAELDLQFRHGGDMLGGMMQSGKKFVWFDMGSDQDILEKMKKRIEGGGI